MDKHPEVGDIISSKKFEQVEFDSKTIKEEIVHDKLGECTIETEVEDFSVLRPLTEFAPCLVFTETITSHEVKGAVIEIEKELSLTIKDKKRGKYKYVVEHAAMEGGCDGRDAYPDGHHVLARRLKSDGTYDPKGEVVDFYTSGFFTNQLKKESIELHGVMKKIFIKE